MILVPIGGGGLISGVAEALERNGNKVLLWGAEPAMADDAARSLEQERGCLMRENLKLWPMEREREVLGLKLDPDQTSGVKYSSVSQKNRFTKPIVYYTV